MHWVRKWKPTGAIAVSGLVGVLGFGGGLPGHGGGPLDSLLSLGVGLQILLPAGSSNAPPVGAAVPAQRMPLTRTNRDCPGTTTGPTLTDPFGFTIVRRTGSGRINTTVVVQGATPNTTYGIRVIQLAGGAPLDCGGIDGSVTTDGAGNGETNVQEGVNDNADQVWVDLNNVNDQTDFLTSAPVTIG